MCRKNNLLLVVTLVCIAIGLFASHVPFVDIESDGLFDSHVNDDLLLVPSVLTVTGLLLLLTRIFSAYFAAPEIVTALLVPPPISN